MEVYNVPEHGHEDAYLIQGTEHLASPLIEQFEAMYNEGAPEFAVQQGLYYPTATNYGYISTGLESPGDWDDHQRIFGLDGQEIQYSGAQAENFPYVYYTPSYGYSQSPFNPYNPYIPGAMIGVDAPYIGSQHYYSVPSYENTVSSPGYYPMVVQSRPDIVSNGTIEPFMDTYASITNRADGPGLKHNLSSASASFTLNPSRIVSNQTNSFTRGTDGSKVSAGPSKQPVTHGTVNSSGFSNTTSSHVFQGRGTQVVDNALHGKVWSNRNQLKVAPPSSNGLSSYGSTAHGRTVMDKVRTKVNVGRASNDLNGSPDASTEQNRGPRTNKSKNQLAVKAYTSRAGDSDAQGNIIIYTDRYNKDDFPVDYVNAKFFVIKSYSEDDVHKSIKYNVWSSTPNGNKKLNIAYDDAQRLAGPRGCPIFLFFSVNASGQFCGVAEMIGAVDFHKDMDFWQQDKWCGSFPVKWHIIKDVPNPNFRHIILENNENKPVTNSRDTQEIRYKKGMEMLKIFKNYMSKTSLLDDFQYYENRQKLLQEEKARLLIKSYENPFRIPLVEPPRKLSGGLDLPPNDYEKITKHNDVSSSEKNASTSTEQVSLDNKRITKHDDVSSSEKNASTSTEQVSLDNKKITKHNDVSSSEKNASTSTELVSLDNKVSNVNIAKENVTSVAADYKVEGGSVLKIGSLDINPKQAGFKPPAGPAATAPAPITAIVVTTEPVNIVTVGSMPVKVNGFAKSAGFLTVGTIPIDPTALQLNEAGLSAKSGSGKC